MSTDRQHHDLAHQLLQYDSLMRLPARWSAAMDEVARVTRFTAQCLVCLRTWEVEQFTDEELAHLHDEPGQRAGGRMLAVYMASRLTIAFKRHDCLYSMDQRTIGWDGSAEFRK